MYPIFCIATPKKRKRKDPDIVSISESLGGTSNGNRTRNLLITNQLLCQLSYTSTISMVLSEEKDGDAEGARTLDLQRDRLAF